jgi:hypothetical protein
VTDRAACFAAVISLIRAGSAIGDHWVSAAKAVSIVLGVSLAAVPGGFPFAT